MLELADVIVGREVVFYVKFEVMLKIKIGLAVLLIVLCVDEYLQRDDDSSDKSELTKNMVIKTEPSGAPPLVIEPDEGVAEDYENTGQATEILSEKCGTCHKSTLKTAKEPALRVFDLDRPLWYSYISAEAVEGIGHRTSGGSFSSDESKALNVFLNSVKSVHFQQ